MTKLQNMRIVEIPKFRAVSSGTKTLGEIFEAKDAFAGWAAAHQHLFVCHVFEPNSFLWHEDGDVDRSVLIFPLLPEVTESDVFPYEIIEFPGGMFLVGTGDEMDQNDLDETVSDMFKWIEKSEVFEYGDFPKSGMCNMPNPDGAADRAMGIAQQQIFLPIKRKRYESA